MYLAPPAARLQHLLANSNDSSQNDGIGYDDNRDSDSYIKDLRIPLFVQIPRDEDSRTPILSPPSSNGSDRNNTLLMPSFSDADFQYLASRPAPMPTTMPTMIPTPMPTMTPTPTPTQHRGQYESSLSETPCRRFVQRLLKALTSAYYLMADLILLVLVCVIGLFFHVDFHVVKHRSRRRRGHVIIRNDLYNSKRGHYRSSELLRPLSPEMTQIPSFIEDDMV